MAVHPKVAGRWLADICAFGEVSWSTSWVGGLDTFSWAIQRGRYPALRRGATVDLRDGGFSLGLGTVTEVTADQVHGEGLARFASNAPALDASANPSVNLDVVIDQAIARGDLPGWSRVISLGAGLGTAPDTAVSVADLLAAFGDFYSAAWYLTNRGELLFRTLPTTPAWQTTPADGQLTTASDDYATHLVATFYVSAGVADGRTYGDAGTPGTPSYKWGRRTQPVDLRPLGVLSTGTVDSILAGMLAKGMARPTWADTLEVTADELTTLGGTPAYLPAVAAGDGIRLHGTFDDSLTVGGRTDITAGQVEYVDGAATARITPVGYTPRDLKTILTVALEGAA